MKPEEKLIELLENCVQKDGTADSEDVEIALKEAYNLGIETAAEEAETREEPYTFCTECMNGCRYVDKESILKHKI